MLNIVLSVEKLNDLQICPLLYYYKHEAKKVPTRKADFLETGELIHEMLRIYYQSKIDKNVIPIATIIELGRNYAAKNLALKAEEVEVVIRDIKMYFEFYGVNESWLILGAEEPFAKELYIENDFRIILTGKTDLRVKTSRGSGPLALVDHKYEARFEEKLERDNQPIAYCWAFEINDFIYNRIGKQKSKKVEEKLLRPYISYAKYQINDWIESAIETARDLIRFYTTEKYPMRYHGCRVHGRKCTFYDVCNTTPDNRTYKLDSLFKDRERGSLMGDNSEKTSEGTVPSSEAIQEES